MAGGARRGCSMMDVESDCRALRVTYEWVPRTLADVIAAASPGGVPLPRAKARGPAR